MAEQIAALTQHVTENFPHDTRGDVDQRGIAAHLLPLVALVVGQLSSEAGVEFFRDAGWQWFAAGQILANAWG